MATVLYIHGFLSAPQSYKASLTQEWLTVHRPDIKFICPALSSYPRQAAETLVDQLESLSGEKLYLIGSSLGGFWATWLIEQSLASKAVLINPAVAPQNFVRPLLGQKLKSYYIEQEFTLSERDLADIESYDTNKIKHKDRYWLMVQTGDQTLPYEQAVQKYSGCKQLVEQGGSHTFDGYKNWLPKIIEYFELKN